MEVVCVTGASGFIGSWLVRFLLQRGYRVRGTVQNIENERETKHLMSLEGAEENLELFQIDLLDFDSLARAIGKSNGVFHLASPCTLDPCKDPQAELIDPAVQGTINVLKASHAAGVKKVVVTSSIAAMFPNPELPPPTAVDENTWTDIEYCKEREFWYPISKTLAEKAAWKFAEENGLDVVVINPGCVLGYSLQPALNASSAVVLDLINGSTNKQNLSWLGMIVHVEDVARAQILLYESPNAKGRHLCTEDITHFSDFAEEVSQLYPHFNVYKLKEDTHLELVRVVNPSKKLLDLGFSFSSREKAIQDTVRSFQEKGLLSK